MISPSILSTCFYFGKHILTNHRNIGFVAPKITPSFVSNSFSVFKPQEAIKLPEKPKKPASPFFKFIQEQKPSIQQEHPELKVTEIVKKCSEDWKNIHSTVKEKYEIQYKEEMEIYAKKYMEYCLKLSEEQKTYIKELSEEKRRISKKRKSKKKLRELNKPKKPPSAFLLFLLDQAKIQNRKVNELMKEAGYLWEHLKESEKLHYMEQAKLASATYQKNLDDWETKMLKEGNTNVVRVKTLEEKRPVSSRKAKDSGQKNKNDENKLKE